MSYFLYGKCWKRHHTDLIQDGLESEIGLLYVVAYDDRTHRT